MYGAEASRLRSDQTLPHERAICLKHLNPVVDAVADVQQAVLALHRAVHGRKLLRSHIRVIFPLDRIPSKRPIRRPLAVGAPMTLVGSRVGVEDDDATVPIAIRDEQLVRLWIDDQPRWPREAHRVVARLGLFLADPENELSVARELQNLRRRILAAHPDIVLVVEVDAVLRYRPLHLRMGPPDLLAQELTLVVVDRAPLLQEVARLVELEDRRGRKAA